MYHINKNSLFCVYYKEWIELYKKDAVRSVTYKKYELAYQWLIKLCPKLKLKDITRLKYQELINSYSYEHEKQTVMDFHHLIKASILDAVDERLIPNNPTRKIIIKGKKASIKKDKFLNQFQLHSLISSLNLSGTYSFDYAILLMAKTGIRFSECLGLTKKDFDFINQTIYINKTYNYKKNDGFQDTKNKSSKRKIQVDWQTTMKFNVLLKEYNDDDLIFVNGNVFNSTFNYLLKRRCIEANIPIITIHSLRHTHASILLYAGVSIASVAKRLGHSSIATTQKTYIHIISEMENQDIDIVMRSMSVLN